MFHFLTKSQTRYWISFSLALAIHTSASALSILPGTWIGNDLNPPIILENSTGIPIDIEIVSLKLVSHDPIDLTPTPSTSFSGHFEIEIEIIPLVLSPIIPYNASFNVNIGTPGINPLPPPALPDTDSFIIPLDPFGPIQIDPLIPFVLPEPDFRFLPNGGGALGGEATFENNMLTESFFDIEYEITFYGIGSVIGPSPPVTLDKLVFEGKSHLQRIIPLPSAFTAGLLGLTFISIRRHKS